MSNLNEILGPARKVENQLMPRKAETTVTTLTGEKINVRTYYRRRDGVVTQRKWRTVEPGYPFYPTSWDRVDTCRARNTAEALRIFKNRPTPEGSDPVSEASSGK